MKSEITENQVREWLAEKCSEAAKFAPKSYIAIEFEAVSSDGKVTVSASLYSSKDGHATHHGAEPIDGAIKWLESKTDANRAKDKRAMAAKLLAEAEQLEAQP